MKKGILIEIICIWFFTLFLYTSLSKFFTFNTFVWDLGRDPYIGHHFAKLGAIIIPSIEVIAAVLIVLPKTRVWGLYSALALMLMFTMYVGWMIQSPIRHCTCGGVLRQMTWQQHLWFNVCCTLISLMGIIMLRQQNTFSRTDKAST